MSNSDISVISQELIYDHGFDSDKVKFLDGDLYKITGISKKWIILTNFHGSIELNTTPQFIQGKRTLSWATPFEYSRFLFSTLSDSHNYSALLLDWATKTGINPDEHHYYRDQITFLLIPPQKEMTFLAGFAAPQNNKDERNGGGVQLRFRNIPTGTIAIQAPLQVEKSKTMEGGKESKIYDFEKTYENAMNDLESYIDNLPASSGNVVSIPHTLFAQPLKIYSTIAEDLDIEELEKSEMSYFKKILERFDISRYIADHWNISHIEEISLQNNAA